MAKDNIENKIFHIYLQLGFIIPSTVLLVCSECIHWFSCVSIPFLFGVLPAFILILFLKKGKSRQKQVIRFFDNVNYEKVKNVKDDFVFITAKITNLTFFKPVFPINYINS
jgi:hypothetical protein